MKDYYKILGVDKGASIEDIKKAYRALAQKLHPDRPEGDASKFKEVNEAYSVLSNKEKREQYDRFGTAEPFSGFGGGQGNPFGGGGFGFDFGGGGDIEDIFETFFGNFGGGTKRKSYTRGADLEYAVGITLEEAFQGVIKKVRFPAMKVCEQCGGKGYAGKENAKTCGLCGGRGDIKESRQTFFGNFARVKQCPECGGRGEVPKNPCEECKGNGRKKGEREVEVEILAGVADGQIIKITKAGEAGEKGGEPGDLYIKVRVKEDKVFERKGSDLIIKKEIKLTDILAGEAVMIKTISGKEVKVEIPGGFNLKNSVVIPGEGMPNLGSWGRGNLIVELEVITPKKLSKKAKELIEKLRREIE